MRGGEDDEEVHLPVAVSMKKPAGETRRARD